MRSLLVLLAALPLSATLLASAPAAQEARVSASARAAIEERCTRSLWNLVEKMALPGGSAALVLPDGDVVALPFGQADVEAGVDMTAEHFLLSGSVGKTYTTAAAHHLRETGALSFDRKAIEFFEDEEWFLRLPNAEAFTVGQLLRHESGLPRYVFKKEFFATCLGEPDKVWKPEELLAFVFDDEPVHAAGNGWAYSDTNYIVLGMILEKVAGKPYYDYVEEHLLEPNQLEATVPLDRRRIPGLAQGYAVVTKQFGMPDRLLEDGVFAYNPQFEWTGGGYASSASDLARWAWLLYRGEAFDGSYLNTMLEAVPARLGPGKQYGYGVMVLETELGPQIGHDGFMTGYQATMSYYPDLGVAAALLLNTDDGRAVGRPLDAVTRELATIVREELAR
jgi:D-alanyl-D-alanine carboxypeptidase